MCLKNVFFWPRKILVGILREFLHRFCTGFSWLHVAWWKVGKFVFFVKAFCFCFSFFPDNKSRIIVVSCRNDYFILDGLEVLFGECALDSGSFAGTAGWQWWVYGPFVVNRFGWWSVAISAKLDFQHYLERKGRGMVSVSKTVDCAVLLSFPLLPPFSFLPFDLRRERSLACGQQSRPSGTIMWMVTPPQQALTKEGADAALDPTSATPWNLFCSLRPRRQLGNCLLQFHSRVYLHFK